MPCVEPENPLGNGVPFWRSSSGRHTIIVGDNPAADGAGGGVCTDADDDAAGGVCGGFGGDDTARASALDDASGEF